MLKISETGAGNRFYFGADQRLRAPMADSRKLQNHAYGAIRENVAPPNADRRPHYLAERPALGLVRQSEHADAASSVCAPSEAPGEDQIRDIPHWTPANFSAAETESGFGLSSMICAASARSPFVSTVANGRRSVSLQDCDFPRMQGAQRVADPVMKARGIFYLVDIGKASPDIECSGFSNYVSDTTAHLKYGTQQSSGIAADDRETRACVVPPTGRILPIIEIRTLGTVVNQPCAAIRSRRTLRFSQRRHVPPRYRRHPQLHCGIPPLSAPVK